MAQSEEVGDAQMVQVEGDEASDVQGEHRATKRKRTSKTTVVSQFTIRRPAWSYLHLTLITSASLASGAQSSKPAVAPLDAITALLHIQSALKQFLGLYGTAVPIDILGLKNQGVWVRLPRADCSAVVAACGGWVGKSGQAWTVNSWNCWGPSEAGSGKDLFEEA